LETSHFLKEHLRVIRGFWIRAYVVELVVWSWKTLATKIAEDFNAKTVLERFADNPFLPKFYKDQNRYAFPLEMSPSRYQQLSDDLAN
jgi:hypothetical protein